MKKQLLRIFALTTIFGLFITACGLPSAATESPATEATAPTEPPATDTSPGPASPAGDSIAIVSVDPPIPAGISIADPVTLRVHYNLTIPEGILQIWFERFTDSDCTAPGYSSDGATTLAGTLEMASGGEHEVSYSIPPLPLLEVAYVGVGVRLWTPDGNTNLVEDMSYTICYAVNEPPAEAGGIVTDATPIEGATAGTGSISGVVYADNNSNGRMDAGEFGAGPYEITLADIGCATTLVTTTTDSNGNYAFFGLPPGTFCVILPYASGTVLPGYWQRVAVVADSMSAASFGLQPAAAPPPPPATGYCGDGAVDASLGEQCDPPNITDCTATCQTYTGYCGDSLVDPGLGEQCDPPNVTNCTASCQTYIGYCGDGFVDPGLGEQCDPPNITDCTASCQIYIPVCGDGWVDAAAGEQCDPPNPDFCTASCQFYLPNCGNSVLDLGEECDPPNPVDCTAQCQNWP